MVSPAGCSHPTAATSSPSSLTDAPPPTRRLTPLPPKRRACSTKQASVPPFLPAITGECALIAPYESRPDRWPRLNWTNHYQPGSSYRTTTDPRRIDVRTVAVRTLRDIFTSYRDHPEAKSLGPEGTPCGPDTVGLLSRRPVRVAKLVSIGKEMNALEEHLAGLRQTEDERLNTHHRPDHDPNEQARTVLRLLAEPVAGTARGARVSVRTVERARAGQTLRADSWRRLTNYLRRRVGREIQDAGHVSSWIEMSADAIFATHLHHRSKRVCECGCGQPLTGRQRKYASNAHRQRARRQNAQRRQLA
jgi:hypothetical protein